MLQWQRQYQAFARTTPGKIAQYSLFAYLIFSGIAFKLLNILFLALWVIPLVAVPLAQRRYRRVSTLLTPATACKAYPIWALSYSRCSGMHVKELLSRQLCLLLAGGQPRGLWGDGSWSWCSEPHCTEHAKRGRGTAAVNKASQPDSSDPLRTAVPQTCSNQLPSSLTAGICDVHLQHLLASRAWLSETLHTQAKCLFPDHCQCVSSPKAP